MATALGPDVGATRVGRGAVVAVAARGVVAGIGQEAPIAAGGTRCIRLATALGSHVRAPDEGRRCRRSRRHRVVVAVAACRVVARVGRLGSIVASSAGGVGLPATQRSHVCTIAEGRRCGRNRGRPGVTVAAAAVVAWIHQLPAVVAGGAGGVRLATALGPDVGATRVGRGAVVAVAARGVVAGIGQEAPIAAGGTRCIRLATALGSHVRAPDEGRGCGWSRGRGVGVAIAACCVVARVGRLGSIVASRAGGICLPATQRSHVRTANEG